VHDQRLPIGAVSERTLDHIPRLFEVFRSALASCASSSLLLIVDQLERVSVDDVRAHLVPHLFEPIANGQVQGVHLVLVGPTTAFEPLRERGLTGIVADVHVEPPLEAEWPLLAAVYWNVHVLLNDVTDASRSEFDALVGVNPTNGRRDFNRLAKLLQLVRP
jgi:hypothetical protein